MEAKKEAKKTPLTCSLCGREADHLHTSPWSLSISAHRSVFEGDLLCDACLFDLEKQKTEEEAYTLPEE